MRILMDVKCESRKIELDHEPGQRTIVSLTNLDGIRERLTLTPVELIAVGLVLSEAMALTTEVKRAMSIVTGAVRA
jgi:hypothetical protein